MNRQTTEGEKFDTLNREDQAVLTPNGDVRYYVNLSKNVTVQEKTPREETQDRTPTCSGQVEGRTYIGDAMFQKTTIGDVLITHNSYKGHNGHQTAKGEFETVKRGDNKILTLYGRGLNTLRKGEGKSPTLEGDNSVKTSAGEYKTAHGDGSISLKETLLHNQLPQGTEVLLIREKMVYIRLPQEIR